MTSTAIYLYLTATHIVEEYTQKMKKTCNPQYETLIKERLSYHLRQSVVHLHPIPTCPDSIVYEARCGETDVIFKIVDPQQEVVTGLVDFGERMSGDPVWDIVEYIVDVANYDISVA